MRFRRPPISRHPRWHGTVDLHSHVLFGLDDGAQTIEDSLEIARAVAADGSTVLAATPHVRDDYPTRPDEMFERLAIVRERLDQEGVELELRPGGEIALNALERMDITEVRQFALAGNPEFLLVETPYSGWPLGIATMLFDLRLEGITPVLAHPERNPQVQEKPELLRPLVDAGALMQVTASSLDSRAPRRTRKVARSLVANGLVHLIASDAHEATLRGAGLSEALECLRAPAVAERLGREIPAAIAECRPVPVERWVST